MADGYSQRSLEDLQRLFAQGDGDALAELLRRYDAHLRACARLFAGGNEAVADEGFGDFTVLLSQALSRGAGAGGAYRPTHPWLPWAKKILANAVYSQLRTLRAREQARARAPEPAANSPLAASLAKAVWEVFRPWRGPGEEEARQESPALPAEVREQAERFREALRECLGELAEADRQLLADSLWGNKRSHEYEEMTSAAVRKRLARARNALGRCVSRKVPGARYEH
jgi:DNA-directed RNA polymerase specialized sigma24 family protein